MMIRLGCIVFLGLMLICVVSCRDSKHAPDYEAVPGLAIGDIVGRQFILSMNITGDGRPIDHASGAYMTPTENFVFLKSEVVKVSGANIRSASEPFAVTTDFRFDPVSCEISGFLKVVFPTPGYTYAFELHGSGELVSSRFNIDELVFPVSMVYSTEPGLCEFYGSLHIRQPDLLLAGQEGVVSRTALISRTVPEGLLDNS